MGDQRLGLNGLGIKAPLPLVEANQGLRLDLGSMSEGSRVRITFRVCNK